MAQESLKSMEETGCPPLEGPILCALDCGFFGTAATLNLCSQCYKIHMSKPAEADTTSSSTPTPAAEKEVFVKTGNEGDTSNQSRMQKSEPTSTLTTSLMCEGSSAAVQGGGSSSTAIEAVSEQSGKQNSQVPKRCFSCKKRVGLTGFDCKCGNMYCSVHRYSDEHNCTFDYKSAGRDAIAQANPVVKADKIEKV